MSSGTNSERILRNNNLLATIKTQIDNLPSGSGDVKLFETEQAMQADTNPSEGDLAVVYREEEIHPVTEESEFDNCTFPNTVVLKEAFTGNIYGIFRAVDHSVMFDGMVDMSSSNFRFNGYGEVGEIRAEYTSQDGITYTRTDGGEELQEFGTTIKWEPHRDPFNDVIGNFMKIGGNYFEGLYQYSSTYLDTNYINTPIGLEITNVNIGQYSSTSSYDVVYSTILCNKIAVSDILEKCNLVYNTLKGSADDCTPIFYVDKNGNYVYMVQGGHGATPSNWYAGPQLSSVVADETNKITKINHMDYDNNIYYATVNPNTSDVQYTFVTSYDKYYDTNNVVKNVRYVYTIPEPAMIPITLTFDYNTRLIKGVGAMVNISYVETNNENFYTTPKSVSNKVSIYYLDPKYLLAKSQLNATPDYVYEKEFYGKNGVEVGTLQNKENLTKNMVKHRVNIWSNYNSGIICPSDASYMFDGCTNLATIPLLNTSNVTDMVGMFSRCTNLATIPLLNTSNVTDMNYMFSRCTSLATIPLLNTSNVTNMSGMFGSCSSLTTIPLLNTSNVTNMNYMFDDCTNLTTIPLLNTSSTTSMDYMFDGCTSLATIPLLNTSNVTNMSGMFSDCTNLTTIPLLNTSSTTSMDYMFDGCTSLTTIPELDTSNVTNMVSMFGSCSSLTTIPLLNTSNVTNMYRMFGSCSSLNNESLNNILVMCTNAAKITSNKTLKRIGLTEEQANKCKTLSNYSAFTSAGWTTGY